METQTHILDTRVCIHNAWSDDSDEWSPGRMDDPLSLLLVYSEMAVLYKHQTSHTRTHNIDVIIYANENRPNLFVDLDLDFTNWSSCEQFLTFLLDTAKKQLLFPWDKTGKIIHTSITSDILCTYFRIFNGYL